MLNTISKNYNGEIRQSIFRRVKMDSLKELFKIGNGPSTQYMLQLENTEMKTQLQTLVNSVQQQYQ